MLSLSFKKEFFQKVKNRIQITDILLILRRLCCQKTKLTVIIPKALSRHFQNKWFYNKSDEASKPDDWIKAGWANKADDWIKAGWAKRTDDWIKAGCEMISMAGWAMMADDWIKAGWANKADDDNKADDERMAIVNVCEFWW